MLAPTLTPVVSTASRIPDAPERDPFEVVRRYKGITALPLTSEQLYPNDQVGKLRGFWLLSIAVPSFSRIQAELRHVSEHALWYVATDVETSGVEIKRAARQFEQEVYQQTIDIFIGGTAPQGRITIVSASVPGIGGYFLAADTLPAEVYPYSNERSILYVNSDVGLGTDSYTGTLAHEFQHLMHATVDSNESTWLNEGLSELAARILGLPSLPYHTYLRDPEVPILNWPENPDQALPNYAGSSLFAAYLMQRVGQENLHRLIAQPMDGVAGVQAFLDEVLTGVSFEEIYSDWLVANVLGRTTSGRYAYDALPKRVTVNRTLDAPGSIKGVAHQFGAWYLNIETDEPLELTFQGETASAILAERPHSGEACWWSNRGDNINSTLTRMFDLVGLNRATLSYWSWYQIEENWDHGYVAVSTDKGESWQALQGNLSSSDNLIGTALGPSYTGTSGGWLWDSVDLSPFAGQPVLVRFEYLTDESINSTGWCIDDIEIVEVGFVDDGESDAGWTADGFVRITEDAVPQRFVLHLVTGRGDDANVTLVELDDSNQESFVVTEDTILVVTAVAAKTTHPASFTLAAR